MQPFLWSEIWDFLFCAIKSKTRKKWIEKQYKQQWYGIRLHSNHRRVKEERPTLSQFLIQKKLTPFQWECCFSVWSSRSLKKLELPRSRLHSPPLTLLRLRCKSVHFCGRSLGSCVHFTDDSGTEFVEAHRSAFLGEALQFTGNFRYCIKRN